MKNFIKNALSILLIACSACLFSGCRWLMPAEEEEVSPAKEGIVRAGVAVRPPFVCKDEEKQFTGLDIELLKLLAKEKGYELKFIEYPLNELVFAVRRGEVDVMAAGFTEREIAELFLAPVASHLTTGQRVIVNAEIAPFITEKNQLDNSKVTIYTVAGSPASEQVAEIFPSAETASLKNSAACIKKVISGKGNGFLLEARDAAEFVKDKDSGVALVLGVLSDEQIAWGVRRKEKKWQQELDLFMKTLKQSGELQNIIDKTKAEIINK